MWWAIAVHISCASLIPEYHKAHTGRPWQSTWAALSTSAINIIAFVFLLSQLLLYIYEAGIQRTRSTWLTLKLAGCRPYRFPSFAAITSAKCHPGLFSVVNLACLHLVRDAFAAVKSSSLLAQSLLAFGKTGTVWLPLDSNLACGSSVMHFFSQTVWKQVGNERKRTGNIRPI